MRTTRILIVLGLALIVLAIALLVVAIWTVGDDSGRWAGTAMLTALLGLLTLFSAWVTS